jgi:hypothetical protein
MNHERLNRLKSFLLAAVAFAAGAILAQLFPAGALWVVGIGVGLIVVIAVMQLIQKR